MARPDQGARSMHTTVSRLEELNADLAKALGLAQDSGGHTVHRPATLEDIAVLDKVFNRSIFLNAKKCFKTL